MKVEFDPTGKFAQKSEPVGSAKLGEWLPGDPNSPWSSALSHIEDYLNHELSLHTPTVQALLSVRDPENLLGKSRGSKIVKIAAISFKVLGGLSGVGVVKIGSVYQLSCNRFEVFTKWACFFGYKDLQLRKIGTDIMGSDAAKMELNRILSRIQPLDCALPIRLRYKIKKYRRQFSRAGAKYEG